MPRLDKVVRIKTCTTWYASDWSDPMWSFCTLWMQQTNCYDAVSTRLGRLPPSGTPPYTFSGFESHGIPVASYEQTWKALVKAHPYPCNNSWEEPKHFFRKIWLGGGAWEFQWPGDGGNPTWTNYNILPLRYPQGYNHFRTWFNPKIKHVIVQLHVYVMYIFNDVLAESSYSHP